MPKMFYQPSPEGEKKVFLAIPTYSGLCAGFTFALYQSAEALSKAGIASELAIYSGDCHVDDARNRLTRDFLETDCTDLVFIDSDLRWNPEDLVKLLTYDRDVVGATYPFKQDDDGYPVRMLPGENWADIEGLIEVDGLPTGFLRIKRHVLEQLAGRAVKFHPKSDDRSDFSLIFERQVVNGYRRGGDYAFCKKWRDLEGKIYLSPEMEFEHYGETNWNGSYGHHIRKELYGPIVAGLNEIKAGMETSQTMIDMVDAWGNKWSVRADLLQASILLARQSKGDILETGCGLTTLAMAAANPDLTVHSVEHKQEWSDLVLKAAKNAKLTNINIRVVPINPETKWYDFKPDQDFDMVLCDGPPRGEGSRKELFKACNGSIANALVIMDDTDDIRQIDILTEWSKSNDRTVTTVGDERRQFSISRKN